MEDMPVLGLAARSDAVGFLFLEHLDLEAVEHRLCFATLQEGDARPAAPRVEHSIPLAAETTTNGQGVPNPHPEGMKPIGFAKRHGEARIDKPYTDRQRHLFEAGEHGCHPIRVWQVAGRKPTQGLGFRIDGDDLPATSQNFHGIATIAAAEVDGQCTWIGLTEAIEGSQQSPSRRPVMLSAVIGGPTRAAILCF